MIIIESTNNKNKAVGLINKKHESGMTNWCNFLVKYKIKRPVLRFSDQPKNST